MERIYLNNSIENNFYVTHLKNISRYLSIYICLFYLIVGNIGTIFKILFFLQKPIRTCPCSAYVIIATINDFITLNNIPILRLLSNLYPSKKWIHITIDRSILSNRQNEFLSSETIIICKIRNYLHMWSADVSIHLLVFASINRYLTSSKKLKQQKNIRLTNIFCNFSSAMKISFGICIIGALISVHHYFNFTVVSNFCIPKHSILWATWMFGVHFLIPSTFMIVFSTLTLINVRKHSNSLCRRYGNNHQRSSNVPKQYQISRYNRSDCHHIEQQLTSMIITETIATTLTTLTYAIYVMYQALNVQSEKSLESFAREDLIEQSVRLTMYLEPSCGFYVYLFTLTTLRKRFFRILLNKIRFL